MAIDPCVQRVNDNEADKFHRPVCAMGLIYNEAAKVHRPMDASLKGSIYDYEPLLSHFCQGQGGRTGFGA